MRIKRTFWGQPFVWLLVPFFAASALTLLPVPARSEADVSPIRIERVVVIPFFRGTHLSATQESLNCPVYRLSPGGEPIDADADHLLTDLVQKALERRYGDRKSVV